MTIRKVMSEEEKQKYLEAFNKMYFAKDQEKEAKYMGIIISNNIDRCNPQLSNCITYNDFLELPNDSELIMSGFIINMSLTKSKKGRMYGLISISDEFFNEFELMTNEKSYLEIENRIFKGNLVIMKGKKMDNTKISLIKDNIYKIDL